MKRRFMFAIIGWIGGTLMGWYIQRLTGWHFPLYLGFFTGILAVVVGETVGKVRTTKRLSSPLSPFLSERRHSQ